MIKLFLRSVLGGISISVCSLMYIRVPNKMLGALLFSFGLLVIERFGYALYTGVIGYVQSFKKLYKAFIVLIGNIVGCMLLLPMKTDAGVFWSSKITSDPMNTLVNAFICGILIYIAVDGYKRYQSILFTLFAIPIFILSGAEHSIADIGYMFLSKDFSIEALLFIVIVIIGNALGSLFIHNIDVAVRGGTDNDGTRCSREVEK